MDMVAHAIRNAILASFIRLLFVLPVSAFAHVANIAHVRFSLACDLLAAVCNVISRCAHKV
jgi:hypothetical protein